ncbi:MAG: hypothetical protein G01um101413_349 [Parcubacteria group bacterium Gr01-1014_13]|nr:MAG: hypothetical protein G01um101413_349 [Parcubacteria group bacterium Gr01-1014_13]
MWYLVIIILAIFIIKWVERTFRWETVIKHLWLQVYVKADQMASHMKQFNRTNSDELGLEGFKAQIEFRGKLINSILDYIKYIKLEEGENFEEETFGYGRYSFDNVLMVAMANPDYFKKFK